VNKFAHGYKEKIITFIKLLNNSRVKDVTDFLFNWINKNSMIRVCLAATLLRSAAM
jgi:hypothetical protein